MPETGEPHPVQGTVRSGEPSGPLTDLPDGRTILRRCVIGVLAMIVTLSLVGILLTRFEPLHGVRAWDHSISLRLAADRDHRLAQIARVLTDAGNTASVLGVMAVITTIAFCSRQRRSMVFVPTALVVELVTFLAVSVIVGRERPDVPKLGPVPPTSSFPSGHVAAMLVCWLGSSLLLVAFGRPLLARITAAIGSLLAVGIGWARVFIGMHHTTDVIFGLLMGCAAIAIAIVALNYRVPAQADTCQQRRRRAGKIIECSSPGRGSSTGSVTPTSSSSAPAQAPANRRSPSN